MCLAAMSPGLFISARRFEILTKVIPLLLEALKSGLEACTSVRNVSLFIKKAWSAHARAFSLYLRASNKRIVASAASPLGVAGVIRFRSHAGASHAVTEQMDVDHVQRQLGSLGG
jgi:hypothetical protein